MKKISRYKEPSTAELRDIPPLAPDATSRSNPFIGRLMKEASTRRGRPKRWAGTDTSVTRSIRFSRRAWTEIERRAKKAKKTVHKYLREAVAAYEPK